MKIDGRILILGTAPDAIARQLAGEDLSLDDAGPLRTDVSTDEITPLPVMLTFDETLARYAHTGLVVDGGKPVAENALREAGVQVIVAGRRYGKGSSREHSPFAEQCAGVRLSVPTNRPGVLAGTALSMPLPRPGDEGKGIPHRGGHRGGPSLRKSTMGELTTRGNRPQRGRQPGPCRDRVPPPVPRKGNSER